MLIALTAIENKLAFADSASMYEYVKQDINRDKAIELYKLFSENVEGMNLKVDSDVITITNGMEVFFVQVETGRFGFSKVDKIYSEYVEGEGGSTLKVIPNKEDARRIAEEFLQSIGLLTADIVFDKTAVNYITINNKDYNKNVSVFFKRQINGQSVYGVSRVVVTIGHNGEIEEVLKLYNEIRPLNNISPMDIISPEEAFKKVVSRDASISFENNVGNVIVKDVELALYEDSLPLREQPYMQPVYVFWGEVEGTNGRWNAVVPARK